MHARSLIAALLTLTCTITMHAERKIKISVTLIGGCNGIRERTDKTITVVLEGDEANPPPMTFKSGPNEVLTWNGEWTDFRNETFPNAPLCASVRFKGGRTYCRSAVAAQDPTSSAKIAQFSLNCSPQSVQQLKIDSVGPIRARYVRKLENDKPECPCDANADFIGTATVDDFMFLNESLTLFLGPPAAKQPRLTLFSIDEKSPAALAFSRERQTLGTLVTKHMPAHQIPDGLSLLREDIIDVQLKARSKVNGDFSSPAIWIDKDTLKGVDYIDITAKAAGK